MNCPVEAPALKTRPTGESVTVKITSLSPPKISDPVSKEASVILGGAELVTVIITGGLVFTENPSIIILSTN